MPSVPHWREPICKMPGHKNANWALELHRPTFSDPRIPKCVAVSKSTQERCRNPAVRGCDYCRMHGGTRYLQQRIEKGLSVRTYGPNNPRHHIITKTARTTKANLSGHVLTRKQKSEAYERLNQSEGLFLKSVSSKVRQAYGTLSRTNRLALFLCWERKNLDPRSYNTAIKELLNGR